MRVRKDARQRDGCAGQVQRRHRVAEEQHRGGDDNHPLHAVTDRVRDWSHLLQNHIRDLLVQVERRPGNKYSLDHVRQREPARGQRRRREFHAFDNHRQR